MPECEVVRVIVVDDEPPGRDRVEELLRRWPNTEIVASVGDGVAAIRAIRSHKPDLVFLDVQMPRMSGLEVVRALGQDMPLTIFVTAFDRHAVAAFELAATDYLVKPFDDERFSQALSRARRQIALGKAGRIQAQLRAVLGQTEPATSPQPAAPQGQYADRIPIDIKGHVRLLPVDQIDVISASGAYAELVVGDKRYLLRETMHALEARLDPARFLRIHRSTIVATDRVEGLVRRPDGDCEVKLRNGAKLAVSRSRRAQLESRMGL